MGTITWRRTTTSATRTALGLLLAASAAVGAPVGGAMSAAPSPSSQVTGATHHDGRVLAVWGWPGRLTT